MVPSKIRAGFLGWEVQNGGRLTNDSHLENVLQFIKEKKRYILWSELVKGLKWETNVSEKKMNSEN